MLGCSCYLDVVVKREIATDKLDCRSGLPTSVWCYVIIHKHNLNICLWCYGKRLYSQKSLKDNKKKFWHCSNMLNSIFHYISEWKVLLFANNSFHLILSNREIPEYTYLIVTNFWHNSFFHSTTYLSETDKYCPVAFKTVQVNNLLLIL